MTSVIGQVGPGNTPTYNSTLPTYTNGQVVDPQHDDRGRYRVAVESNSSSASSPFFTQGWGFSVVLTPTITAGAYTAGDIVGGLLTFTNVASANDQPFILQNVMVTIEAAITSALTLILFNADPTSTTKTDNAAYSLNAADAAKVVATLPFNALGGYLQDHGTPNTYELANLARVIAPASGARTIYGLLIDGTGFTPTATDDLTIRISGTGC